MAMIKMVCSRCGGSGKFSYNLIHGDMCYGCSGSGYVLRDEAKEAARVARNRKASEIRKEEMARRVELANSFLAQFSAEFGIPMVEGPGAMKASYEIGVAVQRKYGRKISDFVNDEMSK